MIVAMSIQNIRLLYNILRLRTHFLYLPKSSITSQIRKNLDYKKYYSILNIPENSDQEDIRKAYLAMVKKYHPDSKSKEADVNKFQEVDNAFRVLMDKMAKERWQVEDTKGEEENEFKHVIPQHRHYLSNHGIGYGTPFQRQKQYAQSRAMRASENVTKHQIEKTIKEDKALTIKKKQLHKIKTKYGFDRLVEDLIQEAISKGQFENLSGTGKPLRNTSAENPYVDFVTHKLNQILIENGFKPEWITLQQEIKDDIQEIRNTLILQRANFSSCPLNEDEYSCWLDIVAEYKELVKEVNKKITKYNLLVPILERQMLLMNLEKEASNVLSKGKSRKDKNECFKQNKDTKGEKKDNGVFYTFYKMFFS